MMTDEKTKILTVPLKGDELEKWKKVFKEGGTRSEAELVRSLISDKYHVLMNRYAYKGE